jgi:hypothetical protein
VRRVACGRSIYFIFPGIGRGEDKRGGAERQEGKGGEVAVMEVRWGEGFD